MFTAEEEKILKELRPYVEGFLKKGNRALFELMVSNQVLQLKTKDQVVSGTSLLSESLTPKERSIAANTLKQVDDITINSFFENLISTKVKSFDSNAANTNEDTSIKISDFTFTIPCSQRNRAVNSFLEKTHKKECMLIYPLLIAIIEVHYPNSSSLYFKYLKNTKNSESTNFTLLRDSIHKEAITIFTEKIDFYNALTELQNKTKSENKTELVVGNEDLKKVLKKIIKEVKHLKKHDAMPIVQLTDVLTTAKNAMETQTPENAQACINLSKKLASNKIGKTLGGLMLALGGLTLMAASAAVCVVSFGLFSPVSIGGFVIGASLVHAGAAIAAGVWGIGIATTGGFKMFDKKPIRKHLEELGKEVDRAAKRVKKDS